MSDNFNVDNLDPLSGSTSPADTPSFDGIEIEVDPGKRERLTKEQIVQYYKGHLRQEDYTRKTQELAAQRRQIEEFVPQYQQLMTEREQIAAFLKNKELLQKYLSEQFPDEKKPSPDELAKAVDFRTLEEREKTREASLQKQIQHLEQQLVYAQQQGQQQLEQRIKDEIETAQYSEKISNHLAGVFEHNPGLNLIDNIEDILRYKVYQAKPKDLNESLQLFDKFAKEQLDKLSSHFSAPEGRTIVKPTPNISAKPKSIEPPGKSSPPPPVKKTFRDKHGKIDWDRIGQEAEQEYRSIVKE